MAASVALRPAMATWTASRARSRAVISVPPANVPTPFHCSAEVRSDPLGQGGGLVGQQAELALQVGGGVLPVPGAGVGDGGVQNGPVAGDDVDQGAADQGQHPAGVGDVVEGRGAVGTHDPGQGLDVFVVIAGGQGLAEAAGERPHGHGHVRR